MYVMPDFEELFGFDQRARRKYSLEGRKSSKRKCPAVLISVRLNPEPECAKSELKSTPDS